MATEPSTESHPALAEVDLGGVASDQHLVGLSMYGCMLVGIAQAVVFIPPDVYGASDVVQSSRS